MIINRYKKYNKLYDRDQQTMKSFDILYRKSLKDNLIKKSEYESHCNVFIKFIDGTKNEVFFYTRK